jgi:hypothetical protein
MILRFKEWLNHQQYREDLIGNFARVLDMEDIHYQFSRRKSDEHRNWADIVSRIAEPGQIPVFNVAWQEFLLAKQVAKDSRD